jgi:activator of HSP90 ATPase
MMKLFRGNERGAAPIYAIGVLILAILLVGGVILLKNFEGNKTTADKPVPVESGEFKADDAKDEKKTEETKKTETAAADEKKSETTNTTNTNTNTVAATGATEYMPEKLTATGPEDFLYAIIGLVLAGGTVYAAWNYAKSRSLVKAKLLQKDTFH